jgi:succinate dehydrogenase / fumarate reductase cytochrome b subunit
MLTSVIGRKVVMALTGLIWYGFLLGHLAGNLTLLAPDGGAAFDAYAALLESLPQVVIPTEIVLIAALVLHIWSAASLTRESRAARRVGYRELASVGDRSMASRTMLFSGLLLAVFLVQHIAFFKYGERIDGSLFALVAQTFAHPAWAGFYVICMIGLGLHLAHALRSSLQTLGLSARPGLRRLSIVLCVLIAGGFALIPAAMFAGG